MKDTIVEVSSVSEEYRYLAQRLGKQHRDWDVIRQDLIDKGKKKYDILKILLADGKIICFTFDVTKLFSN